MSEKPASYDVRMEADINRLNLTAPRVTPDRIASLMERVEYHAYVLPGTTTTVITSYIQIGETTFTLAIETMACVDKRNFNRELGEKYGIEKCAKSTQNKLWELEGYLLANNMPVGTFYDRLLIELNDLRIKVRKLRDFLQSDAAQNLDEQALELMFKQFEAMKTYQYVLEKRIKLYDQSSTS